MRRAWRPPSHNGWRPQPAPNPGRAALIARFGAQITDYDDWKTIDAAEIAAAPEGRVRAKISTYERLLDMAHAQRKSA